ncbi:hypothetical protein ACH4A7_29990 [Streptomyces cyaneofuscatus]|uniref:hypothetical protein n=1 Tax=Streptomyces cyaneofuscatus TaxID=66883 RepID=UPI0037909703
MTSAAPAELGEWERITRLLADAPRGTVYDPDTDDVVPSELADAAREAKLREAMRIAVRVDELQALLPWLLSNTAAAPCVRTSST